MHRAPDVEQLLAELRDEVRRLSAKTENPLPRILTLARAAQEMSISLSKLKQLVRAGALATVELGKRRYVPRIEIERLERTATRAVASRSASRPTRKRGGRQPYDAQEEAAKARAALRGR